MKDLYYSAKRDQTLSDVLESCGGWTSKSSSARQLLQIALRSACEEQSLSREIERMPLPDRGGRLSRPPRSPRLRRPQPVSQRQAPKGRNKLTQDNKPASKETNPVSTTSRPRCISIGDENRRSRSRKTTPEVPLARLASRCPAYPSPLLQRASPSLRFPMMPRNAPRFLGSGRTGPGTFSRPSQPLPATRPQTDIARSSDGPTSPGPGTEREAHPHALAPARRLPENRNPVTHAGPTETSISVSTRSIRRSLLAVPANG